MVMFSQGFFSARVVSLVLVVVILVSGFFFWDSVGVDHRTYVFRGTLESVGSGSIQIKAQVSVDGVLDEAGGMQFFSVDVPTSASIERTTFTSPPAGVRFDPGKLPREVKMVDFKAVQEDMTSVQHVIGIEVVAEKKIIGWKAVRIKYIFPKSN